jgi:cell shape-determining protein MreC
LTLYGTGTTSGNQVQNYFAFVRPQLDQIEANRQQQREIQQLRTQLQKISSQSNAGTSQSSANMGMSAHYMDTAQFYQRQR